jgi:hypothetical protein
MEGRAGRNSNRNQTLVLAPCLMRVKMRIGGPGRDRTDDLFHAMEARSQLRHRPTIGNKARELGIEGTTHFIFAHIAAIVNARTFSCFFPQASSAIIDRAPHLHHFSNTI